MNFESLAFQLPVLLFAMVAHEYAHGYAALKQGDPTAYQLGRLTWNPIRHIDPVMTVLVPLMTWFGSGGSTMFGGAKPVPVVPRNYRHYKRGDIIVSLAGVATNLAIALVSTVLIAVFGLVGRALPALNDWFSILQVMLIYSIRINLVLFAFNLLPIPPLDGSHVFKYLLPPAWSLQYQRLGQYGFALLFLLLFLGRPIIMAWLMPALVLASGLLNSVRGFILLSPWTT